jgi:pimeloyl-ACP methyl ester carboxylesterase
MSTTAAGPYTAAENKHVEAANGTTFVYRDLGAGAVPLVLLQHFRGNLENWDPVSRSLVAQDIEDRDVDTTWQTREAQYDAVCSWGVPNHALLQRVSAIDCPVFIANGDSDPMILPHYSHLLAGLIPQADVKIYPDSAHSFLFQHAAEFAADVEAFLSR